MGPDTSAISPQEVSGLVKGARVIGKVIEGGQKAVIPIELNGEKLALKLLFLEPPRAEGPESIEPVTAPPLEETTERVRREVNILSSVRIPQLARTGPLPLSDGLLAGSNVLYYSEEWIDGTDLTKLVGQHATLSASDTIKLGLDVSAAIEWLWANAKVHRDIKPGNIMRRADGTFVLLDLGYALDLRDKSLTNSGFVVGTPRYFSPEHLDLLKKRNMDFRSDIYCLGVTMYEVSTGEHPYYRSGMEEGALLDSILNQTPAPPCEVISGFPAGLSDVIMRMVAKFPHLRYQSCAKLRTALQSAQVGSGT